MRLRGSVMPDWQEVQRWSKIKARTNLLGGLACFPGGGGITSEVVLKGAGLKKIVLVGTETRWTHCEGHDLES